MCCYWRPHACIIPCKCILLWSHTKSCITLLCTLDWNKRDRYWGICLHCYPLQATLNVILWELCSYCLHSAKKENTNNQKLGVGIKQFKLSKNIDNKNLCESVLVFWVTTMKMDFIINLKFKITDSTYDNYSRIAVVHP